jgi:MFS family permease
VAKRTPAEYKAGRPRFYPSQRRAFPQFQLRPQWWNWTGLKRSIDQRLVAQGPEELSQEKVTGLRFFWLDGVFASFSDNIIVSFIGVFVLAYGATNGQIGLTTAIANLFAVLALFPGAAASDKSPNRKRLVLVTGGGIGRLFIIPLAVLPFFGLGAQTAIWVIILINAVRSFMGSYANPAWTGIVADLVPADRRGRYFSERSFTMGIAALVVTSLGGVMIRRLNGVGGAEFFGFQTAWFAAFAFGVLSTISFSRIPDRRPAATGEKTEMKPLRVVLRGHPIFVAFLFGALVWNLSIQTAAPFFNIFLINELGGTVQTVGLTAGLTSVAGLVGLLVFGRRSDRKGSLSVIRESGAVIPLLPIAWSLATETWHVYLIVAVAGFAWAGYNLANFNLLLELAPPEARARSVALYQTVVFAAAVVGPLLGGVLIDLLSYRTVFLATGIGRLVGIGLFLCLIQAHKSRQAEGGGTTAA